MTADQQYQDTVDGIALARRTVEQTSATIRQAMDNGDDPVIFLHNLAASLGKESPFQAGGQGAAIYTVACFLLAESGFFEPGEPVCICPGPEGKENRAPTEYLATCPIHRGSWAETLEILADRELTAQLTASIEDLGDIEANFVDAEEIRATMEARHAAKPCCVAHVDLECAIDAPESCCDECPSLGAPVVYCEDRDCLTAECDGEHSEFPEPAEMERRYGLRVGQCTDPDCFQAGCDGDHDELRCPATGVVRGNIATMNGKWICCDGDYPDHREGK